MVLAYWYAIAFISAFDAEIDWLADTIYCALFVVGYSPNQDTHDYYDDTVAGTNEVTGTGYTANGDLLTTPANTNSNNKTYWDADDNQWTSSTITARRAVFYDRTPATDATRPLICWVDFESDQSSSSGNFTIAHAAPTDGIAYVTATDATGFP